MGNINTVVDLAVAGGIAVLSVDSPPVNALSQPVRQGLTDGFTRAMADPAIEAVVLICAGRTFIAGADIAELGKPFEGPGLVEVFELIEGAGKPVIAAIHGAALGGGLEFALACHFRVAVPSARFGLPEVHLGLLPGGGGTQRLPRIVGIEAALDLIVNGRVIGAAEALALGIIDGLAAEGKLREDAVGFARRVRAEQRPLKRVRDLDGKLAPARGRPEIFDAFRNSHAHLFRGFKAPGHILEAMKGAVDLPFDEGLKREAELFGALMVSRESAAQRYLFFAEREAAKIRGLGKQTPLPAVTAIGITGAGTMGHGLAIACLEAGMPVTLCDLEEGVLDGAIAGIRQHFAEQTASGTCGAAEAQAILARFTPAFDPGGLADADLLIVAVPERLARKAQVFEQLGKIARPEAILASVSAGLDLERIAAGAGHPERVIGLHFIAPMRVTRLVEIVRGGGTSDAAAAAAMQLARRLGKLAVLSRNGPGFIVSRAMAPCFVAASGMIREGLLAADIKRVMEAYGFPKAVGETIDLVGEAEFQVPGVEAFAETHAMTGGRNAPAADDAEILERLLFPVVNECARIVEENIAERASDVDVALVHGYAWPVWTGGPLFWAGTAGLSRIAGWLEAAEARCGPAFKAAGLLLDLAAAGKNFQS